MKVLVTGASGFVGAPVCRALQARGHQVVAALRRPQACEIETRPAPDLGPQSDWRPALEGVDAIVHCAARAHVMAETESDPLAVFRRVNRDGTAMLAEQAAAMGVRRLVFLSSIKVNGEATPPDRPFRAEDAPAPMDPYGIAKAEAEDALRAIAARTGLGVTILRPTLIHGPGVKGNLAALMGVLTRGLPLPLGRVANRRSLIGIDNLADAIGLCLERDEARGKTLLIRDGDDVSTPELIRLLAAALGRPARLLPVPVSLLRIAGRLTGRDAAVARLTGSLVVDDAPLRALGWVPPRTLAEGLSAMAATSTTDRVVRP